ncbi:hypothetical protein [Desulfosarcina ovata]|uniref:hypothetical protein n=1 Tax=Desulfosarcina ovata TaxID=83564 RepID=UPI0012D31E4E
MSHICGLFSRRACNVQKILCLPLGDGKEIRIWLTLDGGHPLDQIVKQVMKIEDAQDFHSYSRRAFLRIVGLCVEKPNAEDG